MVRVRVLDLTKTWETPQSLSMAAASPAELELSCPVCLDWLGEAVETNCAHAFCCQVPPAPAPRRLPAHLHAAALHVHVHLPSWTASSLRHRDCSLPVAAVFARSAAERSRRPVSAGAVLCLPPGPPVPVLPRAARHRSAGPCL